jgi:hypothetical protein
MAYNWTTEWPGVYARHEENCPLRNGGDCTCPKVTYRASAKAPDQHTRLLSPDFDTAIEARDWLRDQRARLSAATAVADEGPSVSTVIKDFLAAAERGEAHERSGAAYTRQRLSQIRAGLAYVDSEMGGSPLQAVRRRNVQALVDQLHAAGLSSDRVIEVVSTLRELFVYAIQRDLVDFNPIVQLRLPADDTAAPVATAAYAGPTMSMNGNGNGNGPHTQTTSSTLAAATAVAAQAQDQPFADEPTYGPGMAVPDDPPPSPSQPTPDAQWAPPSGSTVGPPPGTPPQGTPMAPSPPPSPGYPYDTGPMFATPPATRMVTPIGAETHYGTPTYGADSVPTQPTVQAPAARDGEDGVVMSEQMFWWITRIVVIVFVLIALVLAAESV